MALQDFYDHQKAYSKWPYERIEKPDSNNIEKINCKELLQYLHKNEISTR